MEEKKLVPQIRFKGYVDTWEQRKLGDIAVISSGIMGDSLLSDGDYRLTRIETIADGIVDESKIGYTNHKPDDNYLLQEGDILYSNINSISHMGKVAIYQGKSRLYHGINLLRLTSDNEVMSPYFLFYQLSTKPKRDWAKTHANQAVSQASINQTLLSEQGMSVCNIAEQKKISMFFSKLDNLITLHQRKYDKLVNIKKSMLEKMFPKNGRDVPEIRFKGFTDAWEQRKWIDVVDISTEMVNPTTGEYDNMPHIAPGNIESFTGRILDNVKTVKEEQLISGKFRFRPDDVVYGKINPQLGKYFYATVNGLTSADAYVFNGKNGLKQKFLFALLQTNDFFKYSVSVSKRSGMPKINRDELNAYSFFMSSEEEQDKIGSYLLQMDNLITLHQRKLEKLKNIKKSMLDKMFV